MVREAALRQEGVKKVLALQVEAAYTGSTNAWFRLPTLHQADPQQAGCVPVICIAMIAQGAKCPRIVPKSIT